MSPSLPAPTERLRFAPWGEDDLPLARAIWGDPRVVRLVGGPFSDELVRQRHQGELALQRERGFAYWPIFLHDGRHAGCCGLKPRPEGPSVLELGFYLLPACWGGGLALEAARAVVHHAFGVVGARELRALHHPENHGSRRTIEKLGFRYLADEHYPPTGLMHRGYALPRP